MSGKPSPLLQALRKDLAHTRVEMLTDPVVMSAEAAQAVECVPGSGPNHYLSLAVDVAMKLPASATPFERGIALGIAIMLSMAAEIA